MDLQRSLLIGAIAVLSFMLLTKWVDFQDARDSAQTQESTRLISSDSTTPELPSTASSDTEEDLPTLVDNAEPVTRAVDPVSTNSGRIIQIHTDVLQLAIDLEGGDIIELDLPKYLAKIDQPEP